MNKTIIQLTDTEIIVNGHAYDRKLVERIIALASDPSIENIVVDGFCGLGGVTEGFERLANYMVIACINHWDVAIATHSKDYPDCLHLQEDFRIAELGIIQYMVERIQQNNPAVRFHLWLSLECTNFSNAKGGRSRDADSRTLADHVDRYILRLNPDVIWIENVKEFKLWGPMIPKVQAMVKGKKKTQYVPQFADEVEYWTKLITDGIAPFCPLEKDKKKKKKDPDQVRRVYPWFIPDPYLKGIDFRSWVAYIKSLGYNVEDFILNCADYGVPQHRVRLIMQFNREGCPSYWPKPTHHKKALFGLPKWKPVKDCLDLEDEGESVLSFVMEKGKLVPRITSINTINRLIKGCDKHVINGDESRFFAQAYSGDDNSKVPSIHAPSRAITGTGGNLYLAKTHMIDHYFGNGYTKPITEPAGVSGTKDGISLHTVQYLSTYHSTGDGSSMEAPGPAVMTKDKYPLVTASPILNTNFSNGCKPITEVIGTQTANRKHYYLVNFQWFNETFRSIEDPANTIVARLDKAPNYLIILETGQLAIEVFDHDPPHYVKLKKYMAENGIVAINMRMLNEIELLKIMSMNPKRRLSRSKTANKKMIGNAVPSDLVEQLGAAYGSKEHVKAA